jgi:hypothetical protein
VLDSVEKKCIGTESIMGSPLSWGQLLDAVTSNTPFYAIEAQVSVCVRPVIINYQDTERSQVQLLPVALMKNDCICERTNTEIDFYTPACKFAYCGCTLDNRLSDSRIMKYPEIEECWQCDDCKPIDK